MELAADLTPDGLRDVLAELGDRVAPTALARERTLPVHPALTSLFPDGGIVRGNVVGCVGAGATTFALAMVRDALVEGAWMAIVDVPTFGPDAANELGVPLERVVRVDAAVASNVGDAADGSPEPGDERSEHVRRWFDVMGAAVDGFDVILAGVPVGLRGERRPAAVRSLVARLQQRGSVVVVLGSSGVLPIDIGYATTVGWSGLGHGHGVIRRRRLDVVAEGRRQPRRATATIDLDVSGRRLTLAAAGAGTGLSVVPDDHRGRRVEHVEHVEHAAADDDGLGESIRLVAG